MDRVSAYDPTYTVSDTIAGAADGHKSRAVATGDASMAARPAQATRYLTLGDRRRVSRNTEPAMLAIAVPCHTK